MTKVKTKRTRFTAIAEHNLGVALADASEALITVRAQPAPAQTEAELWLLNTTWTAATALSQEQLGRMIQSLQRVYWKKRLATEK